MKILRASIFIFLMLITTLSAKSLPVDQLSGDSGDFALHEIRLIGKSSLVDVGTYIDDVVAKIEDNSGSPTPLYYHSDRQFNVRGLTDSTGAVKELYAYSVYGKQTVLDATGTVLAGSSYNNNYGFTGRYLDSETGLWYFRARYFSDELGRFISRDPLGYVDGFGLYGGYFAAGFGLDPSGTVKVTKFPFKRTYLTACHKIDVEITNTGSPNSGPTLAYQATDLPRSKNKKECKCTKCGWVQFVKEGSTNWYYDNGEKRDKSNQVDPKYVKDKRGSQVTLPSNTGGKNIWYPTKDKNQNPHDPTKPNPSMYDTPGVPQTGKALEAKLVCQDSKGNNKEMLYIYVYITPSKKTVHFYSNGKTK